MRILIDADGCPVVDITVCLATHYGVECFILCDTSHCFNKQGATTLTFSKGADSVDYALVNMVNKGDIIITQDYGLAAMCLSRCGIVLNQDGMEYTENNIDSMLFSRHTAAKIRASGGHLHGPKKRKPEQDISFQKALSGLLEKCSGNNL